MDFLHAFGLAVQFLTRLPVPSGIRYSPDGWGKSVMFYPWVGGLIGALLLLLQSVLDETGPLMTAALLLAVWTLLTGGLHLDGLADCADGWVGGQGDPAKSLRIMQDPYSGPIAVASVVVLLLLKFAALAELPVSVVTSTLLWTPVIGRSIAAILLLTTPYIRPNGLGSALVENLPPRSVWLSVGLAWLSAFIALGLWPLILAGLTAWWLRVLMMQRLGGCTGDALGASIEIIEAVMLVTCALA